MLAEPRRRYDVAVRSLILILLTSLSGACASNSVATPESMMTVSKVVDVRVESERRHETLTGALKSLIQDRLRKRGYEVGGSLENWRLDVDVLELDTTKLANQRRLVVELRIRAIGPRGEEYFKHNVTEVTPRLATPEGQSVEGHLPSLADQIVARVP